MKIGVYLGEHEAKDRNGGLFANKYQAIEIRVYLLLNV